MKKFICVLVFLAMVNVANAGIVDLMISSLNGQPITPVKEITVLPTDVVNFDVVYTADTGWYGWSLSLDMVVQGPGTLDISTITKPSGYWNADLSKITAKPYGALLDFVANDIGTVPAGIVLDHFLLHCDDAGDVIIRLVENPNTAAGATLQTDGSDLYELLAGPGIMIHQIPEPMTLTLLGLGGLFLARRKR
jgi:hypothetical protein